MKSLALAVAFGLVLAAPALAQSGQSAGRSGQINGACGQPLGLSYSFGLPIDQVAPAPVAASFVRVEPFYVEFTLGRAERVALRTETDNDATDPVLTVLDTAGNAIASDDDGAGGYNSILDLTLEPGTYCAQVRPLGGDFGFVENVRLLLATGTAAADLAARIDRPAGPADLCADPALTADLDRSLAPGLGEYRFEASVEPGSRRDWRLDVTAPMELQIDATSLEFDTVLTLVDSQGFVVAENDDGYNMGTDSRIAQALEPGRYCLSLAGFDGDAGRAQIAMTDTPTVPIMGPISEACSDPGLTSTFAPTLGPGLGSASMMGTLTPGGRSDWSLEVTAETLLQFDVRSNDFDTFITLLGAGGVEIEANDDEPMSVNSRITRVLGPGSYCLAVEAFGGGGGGFEVAVTDDPSSVPDDGGMMADFCTDPMLTAELGRTVGPGLESFSLPVTLEPGRRQDFRFDATESAALRFSARSAAFDTVLRLGTPGGLILAENDDAPAGGTDSELDYDLAAGEYCLSLDSFAGGGGAAELSVGIIDAAMFAAEAAARGEVIPPADAGIAIEDLGVLSGRVESAEQSQDLAKWVAFEIGAETGVRIDAIALGGGFALRLFTDAGEMVAETYGGGGIAPSRLEERLAPGRYLAVVALDPYVSSRLRSIVIAPAGG